MINDDLSPRSVSIWVIMMCFNSSSFFLLPPPFQLLFDVKVHVVCMKVNKSETQPFLSPKFVENASIC